MFDNSIIPDNGFESYDTDNNGIDDIFVEYLDRDNDGLAEMVATSHDYDQDGRLDDMSTFIDSDGDGNYDILEKTHNVNNPNSSVVQVKETYYDISGNGQPDMVVTEEYHDLDGDGVADHIRSNVEYPSETMVESANFTDMPQMGYDPMMGYVEVLPWNVENFFGDLFDTPYYDNNSVQHFDPATADLSKVIGNPAESMNYWDNQGSTMRCAVYSQVFVIEELTGRDLDPVAVSHMASANGWLDDDFESGGTMALNMNKVLNAYGVENQMSFHNNMDALTAHLQNGDKIIVSIDANQVWFGENSSIFSPYTHANHAVEVIGIDMSNPNCPMVILNDSAPGNGCGEMVPLAVFDRAWATSDRFMITCPTNQMA